MSSMPSPIFRLYSAWFSMGTFTGFTEFLYAAKSRTLSPVYAGDLVYITAKFSILRKNRTLSPVVSVKVRVTKYGFYKK